MSDLIESVPFQPSHPGDICLSLVDNAKDRPFAGLDAAFSGSFLFIVDGRPRLCVSPGRTTLNERVVLVLGLYSVLVRFVAYAGHALVGDGSFVIRAGRGGDIYLCGAGEDIAVSKATEADLRRWAEHADAVLP